MTDLTAAAVPASLLTPAASTATAPSAAELAKRGEIHKTAQKFEASFLSAMIGQMFETEDDSTDPAFSGGQGGQMFKSFLAEAMANKMVAAGGVGLAASVQKEMLKMQGLH
ncbi:rod-binding protein [Phenylobacterium sp.]|uniref:rod-binding protein n=1 Tax=Phenylobacterium sp. TaxID=1871053 RepID=UPI00122246D9|nr:rod-binding protein [Phenylobacterium sp.]THD59401.1 MAG: chemotaxis protein chel [Phenylobacterium sp.]